MGFRFAFLVNYFGCEVLFTCRYSRFKFVLYASMFYNMKVVFFVMIDVIFVWICSFCLICLYNLFWSCIWIRAIWLRRNFILFIIIIIIIIVLLMLGYSLLFELSFLFSSICDAVRIAYLYIFGYSAHFQIT